MRVPDGIMAAYPATMLQSTASPSRLLSLMDPLLPLSVLCKCVSAYAGKAHPPQLALGGQDAWGLQGWARAQSPRAEERNLRPLLKHSVILGSLGTGV